MTRTLKQKLAARETIVGTFVKTPAPVVVEVLAHTALDCLCLDAEHAPFDRTQIDGCILAARALGMDVLVRPPSASPEHILTALDCGATGIVAPHVRSADEARALVRSSHYGPGGRGYAGSSRAAGYTTRTMAAHLSSSTARTVVIAQIEDPEAIDAIDAIAAVEGIDALFVGRADLTVSYGAESQDDRRVVAAVEAVCAAGLRHERCVGMFLSRVEDVPEWTAKGASLFLLGSDHGFMLAGAAEPVGPGRTMRSGGQARGPNFATVEELAPRLADGSISAEALLTACLDAISADDRAGLGLAAITRLNPRAQAQARQLDAERARSGARGPLHGIPMVVKDNIDLTGTPTTSGNRAMALATPSRDAEQVRRLEAAGAVIVAKTNLSEFSFEIRSRSSIGGDVRNPFDRSVTAGGSSGGAAAAVAAGFAVAGLGTDTGGSIRIPAAYNGLVGLRPTLGLVDRRGVAPLAPTTDTVGPLARSVADAARLIRVMTDEPHGSALATAVEGGRGLRGARVGVLRQAFGSDEPIGQAMETAMAMMSQAGATITDPAALPDHLLPVGREHVVDWEFAPAFNAYLAVNFPDGGAPASLADILASGDYLADCEESLRRRSAVVSLDADSYREILAYHSQLRDALGELFDRHGLDALVYPTSAVTPTSLDNPRGGWAPELAACSGWPAITLPVGAAPSGIPIGLELLGRAHDEAKLLALAADLERRVGRRFIPDLPRPGLPEGPPGPGVSAKGRGDGAFPAA